MMESKKPEFLLREDLGKGYYRMIWKVPYLQNHHGLLILSKQWKFDLESGMSPELIIRGDFSFSWETNDKELEANIEHMKEAITRSIPLYEEKLLELEKQRHEMKRLEEEKEREKEEFRKKVEKLIE